VFITFGRQIHGDDLLALLNSQNLSGLDLRTATPASWTNVEEGCHGCICEIGSQSKWYKLFISTHLLSKQYLNLVGVLLLNQWYDRSINRGEHLGRKGTDIIEV
jgi:hypothetical protein